MIDSLGFDAYSINGSGWTVPNITLRQTNVTKYYGVIVFNGPGYIDTYGNANVSYQYPITLDAYTDSSIKDVTPSMIMYTGDWKIDNLTTVNVNQEFYFIGGNVEILGATLASNTQLFFYNVSTNIKNSPLGTLIIKYNTYLKADNITFNNIHISQPEGSVTKIANSTGKAIYYIPSAIEANTMALDNVTIQTLYMYGSNVKLRNVNVTFNTSWKRSNVLNASVVNVTTNILYLNIELNGTGNNETITITDKGIFSQDFDFPSINITYNILMIQSLVVTSVSVRVENVSTVQFSIVNIYDSIFEMYNTTASMILFLNNSIAQIINNTNLVGGPIIKIHYSEVTIRNTTLYELRIYNNSRVIMYNTTLNYVFEIQQSIVNITQPESGSTVAYNINIYNSIVYMTNVTITNMIQVKYDPVLMQYPEVHLTNVTANVIYETYIVNGSNNVIINSTGTSGNVYKTITSMSNVVYTSYFVILTTLDSVTVVVDSNDTITTYYVYDFSNVSIVNVTTGITIYGYGNSTIQLAESIITSLTLTENATVISKPEKMNVFNSLLVFGDNSRAYLNNITINNNIRVIGSSRLYIRDIIFNKTGILIELFESSSMSMVQSDFNKNNNVSISVRAISVKNLFFENLSFVTFRTFIFTNVTIVNSSVNYYTELENTELPEDITKLNELRNEIINTNITTMSQYLNAKYIVSPSTVNSSGIYYTVGLSNATILKNTQVNSVLNNVTIIAVRNTTTIANTSFYKLYLLIGEFTESPNIVEHGVQSIEEGQNEILYWEVYTPYQGAYNVFQNGTSVQYGTFFMAYMTKIAVNLSPLSPGTYNFTLLVELDAYDSNTSTIFVNVLPRAAPEISMTVNGTSVSDEFTFENGLNYVLTVNLSDQSPDTYQLLINDVTNASGKYTQSYQFNISLNDFAPGTYNFTVIAIDSLNQETVKTLIVTVLPQEKPIIVLVNPTQNTTIQDNQQLTITWQLFDASPDQYYIYINGSTEDNGSWTNGSTIDFNLQKTVGTYNITIRVTDKLGNESVLSITITVVSSQGTESPDGTTGQLLQDNLLWIIGLVIVIVVVTVVIVKRRKKK